MSQVAGRRSQVESLWPKFPLYKNDGMSSVALNELQQTSLRNFLAKLDSGEYTFEDNPCTCGAHDDSFDVVITEKDRYGIPCEYVLCMNCGLIRQKRRLDDASTGKFYTDYYRNIHDGQEFSSQTVFDRRKNRGKWYYSFLDEKIDLSKIHTVFETGCADGGILYAFHEHGKEVSGCDYDEKYLRYGQSQGLNLYEGEPDLSKTPAGSQDLVILSHVMEHLNNPLHYMNNVIEFISPGGFLLIQVPGILFCIDRVFGKPILYFQNAHVNNFYAYYLEKFFTTLGLEVIYGDEACSFILCKPEDWQKKNLDGVIVWDESMPAWADKIARTLRRYYLLEKLRFNRIKHCIKPRRIIVKLLELLGVKDSLKKLLGRK